MCTGPWNAEPVSTFFSDFWSLSSFSRTPVLTSHLASPNPAVSEHALCRADGVCQGGENEVVGLTDTEVQAGLGKPSASTWFVWAAVSSV